MQEVIDTKIYTNLKTDEENSQMLVEYCHPSKNVLKRLDQ